MVSSPRYSSQIPSVKCCKSRPAFVMEASPVADPFAIHLPINILFSLLVKYFVTSQGLVKVLMCWYFIVVVMVTVVLPFYGRYKNY